MFDIRLTWDGFSFLFERMRYFARTSGMTPVSLAESINKDKKDFIDVLKYLVLNFGCMHANLGNYF